MNKADVLARIDSLLALGQNTVDSIPPVPARPDPQFPYIEDHQWVNLGMAAEYRTAGISLLYSLYGKDGQPSKDFNACTADKKTVVNYKQAQGIVRGVRQQVDNNWFYDTRALIAADVFSDFLETAEYLLSEGYKDAAAVLIGGALEAHLRNLAPRHQVNTHFIDNNNKKQPKKAESLNQDLYKAGAYVVGDQKNVTAWLDLRNNAAHAHYHLYTAQQVTLMLQGVRDFIQRVPA